MNRGSVISSNIESVGYEDRTLEIAFVDGGIYQYLGVSISIYQGLMSASSKGSYFHHFIKDKYKTIRVA
ncbi:KTSC domain-containing protein [Rickettsiales bacterium]|nr:KTSC domain-containing protein [Rickettsiales bacterium]